MGSTGASVLKILRNAVAVIGDFGAAVSTPAAAMTRIEGFWVYWGGEHYVWAEREVAPPRFRPRGRPRLSSPVGMHVPCRDRAMRDGETRSRATLPAARGPQAAMLLSRRREA